MSLSFLLDSTGHGPFILASYGISFVVMAWIVLASAIRGSRVRREILSEIRARKGKS